MQESESEKSDKKVKVMLEETGKRKWKSSGKGVKVIARVMIKPTLL